MLRLNLRLSKLFYNKTLILCKFDAQKKCVHMVRNINFNCIKLRKRGHLHDDLSFQAHRSQRNIIYFHFPTDPGNCLILIEKLGKPAYAFSIT